MTPPADRSRRDALLEGATRAVSVHGLAATTAAIAAEAGVATGTLFVYFETKTRLLDQLYLSLKTEMGKVATEGLVPAASPRKQLHHLWSRWIGWAVEMPEKRRALAHLEVADEVSEETRQALEPAFAAAVETLDHCREGGPMQDLPSAFVLRFLNAIADTTIDDLIEHPGPGLAAEDPRSRLTFDAMWRALSGGDERRKGEDHEL